MRQTFMRQTALRATLACALVFSTFSIVNLTGGKAFAQSAALPSANPDSADQSLAQRSLTDLQIQNFIAAQKPIQAVIDKLPEDKRDAPDAKTQAALDKIAMQFGFKDNSEFDNVEQNIALIMQGFDPDKKIYVGPEALIKSEIAGVNADASLKPKDKAEALGELKDALKQIEPVKYPDNIKLVTKHYAELSEILTN